MDTSTFTARAMRILSGNVRSMSKCEISRIAYDLITQTKLRRITKKGEGDAPPQCRVVSWLSEVV